MAPAVPLRNTTVPWSFSVLDRGRRRVPHMPAAETIRPQFRMVAVIAQFTNGELGMAPLIEFRVGLVPGPFNL